MKHFFLSVCIMLFATMNSAGQTIEAGEDKLKYETALQEYNKANYSLVITYCNEIQELGGDPEVYRLRARAYRAIGEYSLAAFDYKEALRGKREHALYYERGMVMMCLRKFGEAELDFSNASRVFRQQQGGAAGDFFVYQEEFGRANHYAEKYRQAISSFKEAIQNGSTMAWIDLLSSLFQNSSFFELRYYADSLLRSPDFQPASNKVIYNYISTLYDHAASEVTESSLEKIESAIRSYKFVNNKCFDGMGIDLKYCRAETLLKLGKDTLAYRQYKQLLAANPMLKEAGRKADVLKKKLSLDAEPPVIAIVNPEMDHQNSVTLPARRGGQEVWVQVKDSSGIAAISFNGRPITKWEEDGIFNRLVDLVPGRNEIVITATDKEENTATKKFIFNFEEQANTVSDSLWDADLPEVSTETKYHAVLIAEKDYTDNGFTDLVKPINDANELKNILIRNYEFDEENVRMLTNAPKALILDTLEKISSSLTDADNLLVFYAGHGDVLRINQEIEDGFLIPSDAVKGQRSTYISGKNMMAQVKQSKARHILFILDACFGGALFRSSIDDASQNIKRKFALKSRHLLTSGNIEEVPDKSTFIPLIKQFLTVKKDKYFEAIDLYYFISKNNDAKTLPQFGSIPGSGDIGGQFIFIRRDETKAIK